VIRNGWFSYRWTQIFEMGRIPSKEIVLMAQQTDASATAPFAPPPIEDVLATIEKEWVNGLINKAVYKNK